MNKYLRLVTLMVFLGNIAFAQTNQEIAKKKLKEAFKLEDEEGKYDEALVLIKEAQKLDPDNITYPYELAYTYSQKKEYKKAIEVLEPLLKHKDVYDQVYQMLGNSYDYDDMPAKAIATYQTGLKKFPNSGKLYTELGNMKLNNKEPEEALKYYEKGIDTEPTYASNYYRASKIFLNSGNKVWGMIYGEIFMNIERNSKRTEEMSELLFNTYKSQITFSQTGSSVAFEKNMVLNLSDVKSLEKQGLPFASGIYELTLALATVGQKEINQNTLSTIRSNFIKLYFDNGHHKKYPNVLFDFQREIEKLGHAEAYSHWILMQGDLPEFRKWSEANQSKWESFTKWFNPNPLKLTRDNKTVRSQYN